MAKRNTEILDVPNLTITSPSVYEVKIQGLAGILFNKMPDLSISKTEKNTQEKEDPLEREKRTWKEKLYLEGNQVIIPGENIHEAFKEASRYWGQKIPGEGNKTYTDVIAKAIVCENVYFGVTVDDPKIVPFGKAVNGNPSKGKKSGSKVYKIRPLLMPWEAEFRFHVFDGRLTIDVLRVILSYCGMFIGLCDWRPTYGRFNSVSLEKVEL
jgi:hypothetical protein